MIITRTEDEIIIRLAPTIDVDRLQDLLDWFRYEELTSTFKVNQEQVDELVADVKRERRLKKVGQ